MKLPAYVNIESKPFDPDLYRETLDDDPVEGNTAAKSKMIGVRNTIRWKWVTGGDGEMVSLAAILLDMTLHLMRDIDASTISDPAE